jgi:hypothetical protein
MFVWELVSCRLRMEGWDVWHTTKRDPFGATYTVHVQRPGLSYEVCGPTLTEAYAAAARRIREAAGTSFHGSGPHFARAAALAGL